MSFLRLDNIKKSYADVSVIKGVSFEATKGEFVVFVGPSGCGKSTLLRMIAGLEDVTSGQLYIDGRDVTYEEPAKREVSMVFQSYALYPHMSVFENMAFGLRMAKKPEAEIKAQVAEAARILQLEPLLDRKPRALSGGQRQRVAIGRSIVRHPKLFLFDEPLSNLDAALRGNTRVEILKLHRALGATTIYVTHDQVEAMTLADRVVVMRDGAIEQVGSPLELYDRPANRFVAQFIGMPPMNLLAAHAVPGLSASTQGRLPRDGTLGIRPEALRLSRADAGPSDGAGVQGRVDLIEALGADTLVHVDVAGVPLVARQTERMPLAVGDGVRVSLDPGCMLHLFDRDGRALAAC